MVPPWLCFVAGVFSLPDRAIIPGVGKRICLPSGLVVLAAIQLLAPQGSEFFDSIRNEVALAISSALVVSFHSQIFMGLRTNN